MNRLAEICIRRPVFAAMLILSLVVIGMAGRLKLGEDRFPSVELPQLSVRTSLVGASTEEVETLISQRIEESVNAVGGIDQLRSISTSGVSIVLITFDLNRDIDIAAQDVRDRVAAVARDLPQDADAPIVSKTDNDQTPVVTIAIAGERPLKELTEVADKLVKKPLERVAGVGEIALVGGAERAISVEVDADRLAAYQLPITAVRDAVARQNSDVPGGFVTGDRRESSLRTMGRLEDARAFEDLVLATVEGVPVRVKDVGAAFDGTKELRSDAHLNGTQCVTLEVRRQSGANTVAVIDGAKKRLDELRPQLPPDVHVEVIRDQSRYIRAALDEIQGHLILGSLLACAVVLAFLRNWRSTFIAGIAIPTSVIASFGVMYALGFTLNSVTMLALVLMVGIVIDDAIVVLENVFRRIDEHGEEPFAAAASGTAEISLAVMATTLSLVVIFVPVSFMSSISGRFLYQFGFTAAAAVLVSLLVSFTLTPTMSARLLRREDKNGGHGATRRGLYGFVERAYLAILRGAMRVRWLVIALVGVVLWTNVPLYRMVKQEYIPSDVDEAEFDVNVTAPEGTSFLAMQGVMHEVETTLSETRGVRLVLGQIGGNFLNAVNTGTVYVRIAPHEERLFSLPRLFRETLAGHPRRAFEGNYSQRDVMIDVRKRLGAMRDLRFSVRNAPSFNIGGGNFDIDFSILGPDLKELARAANELRTKAIETGGVVDADVTLKLDRPELRAEIDRARAADLGVDVEDVATALRIMVGGAERVSRFRDPEFAEEYDVRIRLRSQDRSDQETIERLFVPSRKGGDQRLVRLDSLVKLSPGDSPSRVDHLDRQRQVSLRGSVAPGFALADRIDWLRGAATSLGLSPAYTTRISGRGRELERTFGEFIQAFLLSIVLMYIVLAAQFESLVHPFTILLSLPLSFPFALISLWLTDNTLNLFSALGMLVLFGVVKKNAILQIDHTNQLRARGKDRLTAILDANRDRLRPILMTTFALVMGMVPLAVGSGPGAEERRAVAVVVIGGQTLSLLLTLVVTPVAYSLFDDLGRLLRGKRRA